MARISLELTKVKCLPPQLGVTCGDRLGILAAGRERQVVRETENCSYLLKQLEVSSMRTCLEKKID